MLIALIIKTYTFVAFYNDQCSQLILTVDITSSLLQYRLVTINIVLFKQQNNPIAIM